MFSRESPGLSFTIRRLGPSRGGYAGEVYPMNVTRTVREGGLDVRPRIDVVRRATNPATECRGRAADDHHVDRPI
jgi:hypothetical protein